MLKAMCIAGAWYFPNYSALQIRSNISSGHFDAYDAPGGFLSHCPYRKDDDRDPYAAVTVLGCTVQGNDIWLHVRGRSDVSTSDYELEQYVKLDDVLKNPARKISITSGRWNN